MNEEEQKDMQQKYLQLQILDSQINQLQKQHRLLDEQISEITISEQGLGDLSKQKIGSEILTHISPGIFIKAGLKNNSEVIVNVGSNVAVKKPIPAAKKMLEKQITEMKEAQTRVLFELTKFTNQAMALEVDINNISKK